MTIEFTDNDAVASYIRKASENGQFDKAKDAYYAWQANQHINVRSSGQDNGIVLDAWEASKKLKLKSNKEKSQSFEPKIQESETPKSQANKAVNTHTTKKAVNHTGTKPQTIERLQSLPKNAANKYKGTTGDPLVGDPKPFYIKSSADTIVEGKHNACIVLQRDRNASRLSGYAGKGDTQCGAIDIVVGRGGYKAAAFSEESGGQRMFADPDFVNDAARIYISQKTDIDENFNIVDGQVGNAKARSGIGIKADQVRIMAREGIKLVTRMDQIMSQGADVEDISGIDLIATNFAELQPLVKGKNLEEALVKMADNIDALNGIVDSLLMYQSTLNDAIINHSHFAPAVVYSFPGGVVWQTSPSFPLIQAGIKTGFDLTSQTKKSEMIQKANLAQFKFNYFNPAGGKYINSRYNNTT